MMRSNSWNKSGSERREETFVLPMPMDSNGCKLRSHKCEVSCPEGLVVRKEPKLAAEPTGRLIKCNSTVTTDKNILKDGDNFFIEISEGGWVVVKQGTLNTCERIKGPVIVTGDWMYEVINPFGSRFAKSFNMSEAKERHEMLHKSGSIVKAIRKRTEIGSAVTMVQLDLDYGWIFEHSVTGLVLDRQGDELVVLPVDENRDFRDFYAKVVNPNGIQIVGTPIGSSVSKGRLEKDKIFQCWETLTVPIYPEGIDKQTDPKHTTPIGIIQYFRLKDKKGWVLSTMRRNNEQSGNSSEISSQYTIDVVEVRSPKFVPSSSSVDGKSVMPTPRAKQVIPLNSKGSLRDMDAEIAQSLEVPFDPIGEPIDAPELDTYCMKGDDSLVIEDRVIEDSPIEAWYRVIYNDGVRLRSSASMHHVTEIVLPFGCYIKASRRTVTVSRSKPGDGAGGAVISSLFNQKEQNDRSPGRAEGSKSAYLQLSDCIGADVNVEGSWIFETITDLDAVGGPGAGVIIAAERTNEPTVEIECSLLMVLYPTGISLRATPHLDSLRLERVVDMYECIEASAMVTSHNNLEKFARVDGDCWLPCMALGTEVVVEVPRQPHFRQGLFEITMKSECVTLVGPYPESPLLSDVFPKGTMLHFDLLVWYPLDNGTAIVSEVFMRLQQFSNEYHVPDIWIRRDDGIHTIIERSQPA